MKRARQKPIRGVKVGDRYRWIARDGSPETALVVTAVLRRTVKMRDEPHTFNIAFYDWHKASKSPTLVKDPKP